MFNDYFGHLSMRGFLKFLKKLQKVNNKYKLAENIYVSMPVMEENTNILDFSGQMEKYETVKNWAESNPNELTVSITFY